MVKVLTKDKEFRFMVEKEKIISEFEKTKSVSLTSCLLGLPETEIRYILVLNNIEFKKESSRKITKNSVYKKRNGVRVHRAVAEQVLGRVLLRGEIVHHIDFNRQNNNKENLVVLSRIEHRKIEKSLNNCISTLIYKNQLEFNLNEKIYKVK